MTEHVADAPVPLRLHGDPVKDPEVLVKLTVPVGVDAVPTSVSETVAVQFAVPPVVIVLGVQLTVVVVARRFTISVKLPVLPLWFASPLYVADTDSVPAVVGVMTTEHEADVPVPASVQTPPGVKVTVPVGVDAVPTSVSVTVALHVVGWPTTTVAGLHETDVVVARLLTVTEVLPLLVAWVASPE